MPQPLQGGGGPRVRGGHPGAGHPAAPVGFKVVCLNEMGLVAERRTANTRHQPAAPVSRCLVQSGAFVSAAAGPEFVYCTMWRSSAVPQCCSQSTRLCAAGAARSMSCGAWPGERSSEAQHGRLPGLWLCCICMPTCDDACPSCWRCAASQPAYASRPAGAAAARRCYFTPCPYFAAGLRPAPPWPALPFSRYADYMREWGWLLAPEQRERAAAAQAAQAAPSAPAKQLPSIPQVRSDGLRQCLAGGCHSVWFAAFHMHARFQGWSAPCLHHTHVECSLVPRACAVVATPGHSWQSLTRLLFCCNNLPTGAGQHPGIHPVGAGRQARRSRLWRPRTPGGRGWAAAHKVLSKGWLGSGGQAATWRGRVSTYHMCQVGARMDTTCCSMTAPGARSFTPSSS